MRRAVPGRRFGVPKQAAGRHIIPGMIKPDLERLWEEHTAREFLTRDAASTIATMVDDAYANHVPVMTGGCGQSALLAF